MPFIIGTIDYRRINVPENAVLGSPVFVLIGMPVEVIGRYVQQQRHLGRQVLGTLQLETRKFQNIDIGLALIEQVECRLAKVAPGKYVTTVSPAHVVEQGRDRALAVGPGNGDERLCGIAREQLDVRHDLEIFFACLREQRVAIGNTGRSNKALDALGHAVIAKAQFSVRPDLAQLIQSGWLGAAVVEDGVSFTTLQVARDRQACGAETHDQILVRFLLRFAHRIFRLARPIRTRMTVIIQNRTMTFGSAQPFSSK
jgi:hypothetical protein